MESVTLEYISWASMAGNISKEQQKTTNLASKQTEKSTSTHAWTLGKENDQQGRW